VVITSAEVTAVAIWYPPGGTAGSQAAGDRPAPLETVSLLPASGSRVVAEGW